MNLKASSIFYTMGIKENMTGISTILGRTLTLVMLLVVWDAISSLFPANTLESYGVTRIHLQYYFAITEVMAFSLSYSFIDLQTDIKQGHFEMSLLKPQSFMLQKLSLWLGQGLGIAIILFPISLGTTYILTEFTLPNFEILAQTILHIIIAMFILGCIHYIAGTACLWIKHSEPAYWILQKFNFVFGGLMLPITLYPDWIISFCWNTPFPAILYLPASTMLPEQYQRSFTEALAFQGVWAAILLTTAIMLHKLAITKIIKTGGSV